jgi:hypothetical protein
MFNNIALCCKSIYSNSSTSLKNIDNWKIWRLFYSHGFEVRQTWKYKKRLDT